MKVNAPTSLHEAHMERLIKSNGPLTKLDFAGDPRLIKGGCIIRMSGIDELPQLINILKGEMSLIGPRPCMPSEYALYEPHQVRRFQVRPGLTGLWQVNRTPSTTFRDMVQMDDDYVDSLSPILDLKILAKTPMALLKQVSLCADAKAKSQTVNRNTGCATFHMNQRVFRQPMSATQKLGD